MYFTFLLYLLKFRISHTNSRSTVKLRVPTRRRLLHTQYSACEPYGPDKNAYICTVSLGSTAESWFRDCRVSRRPVAGGILLPCPKSTPARATVNRRVHFPAWIFADCSNALAEQLSFVNRSEHATGRGAGDHATAGCTDPHVQNLWKSQHTRTGIFRTCCPNRGFDILNFLGWRKNGRHAE
jgi:hypothetical protein